MRILWILPYLPWPTTSGGKTRQFHLIRSLAQAGHDITLLVQSKSDADDATRAALEPLLEQLIVLPRRPLRSLRTLWHAVFSRPPLLATVNGFAPQLEQRFAELLQEPWDVIQIEHSYSFQPYARALSEQGRHFILTEHNVESALGAATYNRFPKWLSWLVRADQWRYRRWEQHVLRQASLVVCVTSADALALSPLCQKPCSVVVNGVDCQHYANVMPDTQSQNLLFIGNYEYPPNVDAVEWALDEILPRLWQLCPLARFSICGYALPDSWRTRWSDSRIDWHGFVDDLAELQRRSCLFFAPLRHGGGSKLKVLEAMAAGLPVVTTVQGVSGLRVIQDEHFLGAEDAEGLAQALARLLQQPQLGQSIGEAGRTYVQGQHDWSIAANQLDAVYKQLPHQSGSNL